MTKILKIPQILLPNKDVDMSKWATVACDQFCAEPAYWQELYGYVGDSPSTLKTVIPEIYLNGNMDAKIDAVLNEMDGYLEQGLFYPYEGLILVEREVSGGKKRVGLMLSFDLEAYDWERIRTPIRATEDTIMARLPVRVDIRRKAKLEFPHAILLADDEKREIIEELYANKDLYPKLYDFDLNMGGGRIKGYAVSDGQEVLERLEALLDPGRQEARYGCGAGILFAVGDGNHSVAAAKIWWDNIKQTLTPEERENHPARYMLAELVNIYDEGMEIHPIHRYIFKTDEEAFISALSGRLKGSGCLGILTKDGLRYIDAPEDAAATISEVQEFVEEYIVANPPAKVEYVHNDDNLAEVVVARGGVGLLMPVFPAEGLFNFVVNIGNLPKKAFSIGEAKDKRYYLEGKKIVL